MYVVHVLAVRLSGIYNALSLVRGTGSFGCTKIWDPVPLYQWKGIVYQIPCLDYGMMYVIQTGCTLQVHKKEHMQALTNSDAMILALANHAVHTMHMIAWEDVEVLVSNPHPH